MEEWDRLLGDVTDETGVTGVVRRRRDWLASGSTLGGWTRALRLETRGDGGDGAWHDTWRLG